MMRRKACDALYMTREDAIAFSDALLAAIPRLRFVSVDYWKPFVDWDWWRAALEKDRRREEAGLPTERIRHRMRDPGKEAPPYWSSLGASEERQFFGWVLPRGWTPIWGEADEFGVRRIAKPPTLQFFFERSHFGWFGRDDRLDDPPEPSSEDEVILLRGGTISIGLNAYDDEAAAFAKTVFRILFKQSVDRFITVIMEESWRALSSTPWRNRRYGAAGRGAEAWALARRHNYFFSPFAKPASYPFAPGEVLSADERAALKAKWAAELDEEVAAGMRRNKELWEKWRREAEGA